MTFYPWNAENPCFTGDFDSLDPFDHDMKYRDTSQGDGLYFQQSGHMECKDCNHTESAGGWFDDGGW